MSSVVPPEGLHGPSPADPLTTEHVTTDGHPSRSDRELVELLRSGDRDATGELFRRHRDAAARVARQLVRSATDADDIVSDAFSRVFKAIDNGRGPTDNFRAYLYTAIRSSACRRHDEAKRIVLWAQHQHLVDFEASTDPVVETFDRTAAGRAYGSLPERWQTVLWLVDVEDRPASEVAQILGMSPNAVAALSYRAREGLRQGFLTAHSGDRHLDTACEPVRPLLSPYVRSRTSARDTLRVERHIEHCDDCRDLLEELRNVNATILHGIAPLMVPVAAVAALRAAPSWSSAATASAGGAAAGTGAGTAGAATTVRGVAGVATKSSAKFALPFHVPTAAVVGGIGAVAAAAITAIVLLGPATPSPDDAAAAAEATVEGTVATDTRGVEPPGPGATSEVEGSTATSTPGPADVTTTTTTTVERDAAATPSTSNGAVSATTTAPPVLPPPPVGALSVSQVGPLAPGGVGHVIVEAAGLRGADRPVRLQWTTPEGFEVRSAHSDRAVCDGAGCDLAIGGSGPAGVALLIAAAPVPSSDSGISAPLAQAAVDDLPALELLLSDPDQAYGSVAARLPLATGESAYSTRFAGVGRLGLAATGNSVLTCSGGSACSEARAGLGTKRSNDLWSMTQVDTDDDPSTTNSSSAALDLPGGSRIVHAELVWSGQLGSGDGGDPGTVRLDVGAPHTIAAEAVVFGADGSYQASVDVTALLAEAATATTAVPVTVGGIAVDPRPGAWAGWGLAVVVEHADLPRRAAVLALGLDTGGGVLSLLPGGSGRVDDVLSIIWDGDPDLGPDGIDIEGGDTPARALLDPANPLGDLGNSSVSIHGVRPAGPDANTFGVDVDLFRVDDAPRTDPVLRTVAGSERLFVGLLGATIDLG